MDSDDKTMFFFTDGLLSKWGFHDGDQLDDFLFDHGIVEHPHRVLYRVVRDHVLPYLDQNVKATSVGTIHNPVRAVEVDGLVISSAVWFGDQTGPKLTPEVVEVPHSAILACVSTNDDRNPDGE